MENNLTITREQTAALAASFRQAQEVMAKVAARRKKEREAKVNWLAEGF